MRRISLPIAALLAACAALPTPTRAQDSVAPAPTVITFTEDEVEEIVVNRDDIHRTNDRLRAADLAIRVHIRASMQAIMQGHTEGFAVFETWYRRRDARLREEAAQRQVIASIFGKALGLGLDVVIPGSGLFVKALRTGLTTAYDQAAQAINAFDGGDPNMFIAEQGQAIERVRSSYLAQADTMPDQLPQAVEEMKWEYLADAEARGDTSSGLSPHLRQIAAHYGIPEPNAQTIERTKLAVLEAHIRGVFEADPDQQFAARATSGFSSPERYFTAISRTTAYRHAYAGQPDRYCPVELDMMGYGIMGAGQECRRWRTASR
jgi:hypothetical protein